MNEKFWLRGSIILLLLVVRIVCIGQPSYDLDRIQSEKLDRGMVAIREDSTTVNVSWRYLSDDPMDISFDVYRNGEKINNHPIRTSTYFKDEKAPNSDLEYELRSHSISKKKIRVGVDSYKLEKDSPVGYLNIDLDIPPDGVTPDGQKYSYSANDISIGDVDGDGEYEIILKWDPSNARDNAHDGYTGNVYIDCYKLNGEKLWRIDLGPNIRAGAHYTQFLVYDFDGDGKAEVVMKTADGTVDGVGDVIGDKAVDYRNSRGRILDGPEFLTVFEGTSGKALKTVNYLPERGKSEDWGDNYGNRMDRFLACVAYLDGVHPSIVMCRGYYTRTVLVAYDWKDGNLSQRWIFDSDKPGNEDYAGQGNHNLRVGDVDGDGRDEIIYGSCTIDDDGTGLYSTGLGHGDAIHMTIFDPERGGLQVWDCHENKRDGSTFRDAKTGEILFQIPSEKDVGRCMAADIDPNHKGVEMWSSDSKGIRNIKGEVIRSSTRGVPVNMAIWWEGDLLRELQDGTRIFKYDYRQNKTDMIFDCEDCLSNNGTKANPGLIADVFGDWREELILRTRDNKNLRIYVTPYNTEYRFHTFMEEPIYRMSVAYQNVSYNQPTQPGFYFGSDLGKCFPEKELVIDGEEVVLDAGMKYDSYRWSIGGEGRVRKVTVKDIPKGETKNVELIVTLRGMEFRDSISVKFQ